MLINCSDLKNEDAIDKEDTTLSVNRKDVADDRHDIIAGKLLHPDELGMINRGESKHFYSSGSFNLIQLIFYVLKQTGPANLFLTTYSISMESINAISRKVESGEISSVRFLIDNRVRSISPKPFDYLITSFPHSYKCLALHAKVALIWNEKWKISIVGSQNATNNPKLERGIIHTDPLIFDFDYNTLDDEFVNGTT
ncbi:hypothetical protein [Phocaeicola paurosaccharolyticus]|uniref:hypothetical protein n=1 Tax=Phocaeicola paurosaccharolyticus TaxID=732242 RepID=UPI002FE35177